MREGTRLQRTAQRGQKTVRRVDLEGTKEEYLSNLSHVFMRRDFLSRAEIHPPPSSPPPCAHSHHETYLTLWGLKEVMMITT